MPARELLMIEHRLIERMIARIKSILGDIQSVGRVGPIFIDKVVDFIRIYADRTHHGKEEDILFRDLKSKDLSPEDRASMDKLIEDHIFARHETKALVEANRRYRNGDGLAVSDISHGLQAIVSFYPSHIDSEENAFFPAARSYFTDEEDQAMLTEFREFDRRMIHEKYKDVVTDLGG